MLAAVIALGLSTAAIAGRAHAACLEIVPVAVVHAHHEDHHEPHVPSGTEPAPADGLILDCCLAHANHGTLPVEAVRGRPARRAVGVTRPTPRAAPARARPRRESLGRDPPG